jgi:hypothetical protein
VFEIKLEREITQAKVAGKYDLGMMEFGNSRILDISTPQLLHQTNETEISYRCVRVDRGLSWEQIEKVSSVGWSLFRSRSSA